MNCRLEKCGSVAVLVSLRSTLPVSASAMNRSIEKPVRSDRNAISLPSGLIAGPTLRSPPMPPPPLRTTPPDFRRRPGRVENAAVGVADRLVPLLRQLLAVDRRGCAGSPPRNRRSCPAVDSITPTTSSPHRPPTYDQNAWPQRYGKYFGLSSSLICGRVSSRAASRIHIAVCASTGPIDRYSAMPSMNHSGRRWAPVSPGAASGRVVMSNWNA